MSILIRYARNQQFLMRRLYSSTKLSNPATETEVKTIPKNVLEDKQTSHLQPDNGAIYDKKPFKLRLEASHPISVAGKFFEKHSEIWRFRTGSRVKVIRHSVDDKIYCWCLCGKSRNQPICDGTHKDVFLKIKLRPVRFQVEKTGDYWLCNCKQTKHRPFCDGTHKQPDIQTAIKY